MSWKKFLDDTVGTDLKKDVASKTDVDASTISRWFSSGEPGKAENVIKLARAYGREPMAALVAAEFLTPDEAKVRPAAAPDYSQLTNDELLELVRTRMREEGVGEHGDRSAPTSTTPGLSPGAMSDPGVASGYATLDLATGLITSYLSRNGGDPVAAAEALAIDGARGTDSDPETWIAALEALANATPDDRVPELSADVASYRRTPDPTKQRRGPNIQGGD